MALPAKELVLLLFHSSYVCISCWIRMQQYYIVVCSVLVCLSSLNVALHTRGGQGMNTHGILVTKAAWYLIERMDIKNKRCCFWQSFCEWRISFFVFCGLQFSSFVYHCSSMEYRIQYSNVSGGWNWSEGMPNN